MSGGNQKEKFESREEVSPATPMPTRSRLPQPSSLLPRPQARKRSAGEDVENIAKKSRVGRSPNPRRNSDDRVGVPTRRGAGRGSRLGRAQSTMNIATGGASLGRFRSTANLAVTTSRMARGASTANLSRRGASTAAARKPLGSLEGRDGAVRGNRAPERPKWDLKGRMEDLEKEMKMLREQKKQTTASLEQNKGECDLLKNQNTEMEQAVRMNRRQLEQAEEEILSKEKENRILKEKQLDLESENKRIRNELESANDSINDIKSKLKLLRSRNEELEEENQEIKRKAKSSIDQIEKLSEELRAKNETIEEQKQKVEEYYERLLKEETAKRILHNQVQELKGNIRVFCRIRPLLNDEVKNTPFDLPFIPSFSENSLTIFNENATEGNNRKVAPQEFTFDKVFGPKHGQSDVFEEISQLVQSALDGYNVCVFAYGQTGSGKTHTMEGNTDNVGMIARAVEKVFETSVSLIEKGWKYSMKASFLEIYNEQVRDLLSGKDRLEMHLVEKGPDVAVKDLKIVDVQSEDQVQRLLEQAQKNRAVAATQCNERSSRSHSVFQLRITGDNAVTGESCDGTLSLVDLAGSEKLKLSKSEGKRAVEAKNINSSLSCLSQVIYALGQRADHIPFRNSKLTFLLQNSLGGNSKTLMFVNVSPVETCFSETVNSLRFASSVNQCNIGTARKKCKKN